MKLSDDLVLNARLTADLAQRSIAGQIEYWAGLGQAVDAVLRTGDALALRKRGKHKPLSECLASVETAEGQQRLKDFLLAGPVPHYEAADGHPGWLRRTEEDGTQTIGRFVNRQFVTSPDAI